MKKILFTEKQIKSILGEEAFTYLDKEDNGMDFPADSLISTGGEVLTNDPDADEFPTTDKIAASKTRSHPFYRNSGYGTMFEGKKKIVKNDKGEVVPDTCPECGSKIGLYVKGEPVYLCSNKECGKYFGTMPFSKKLDERNHQLDGRTFRLGKNTNQQIDNIASNNPGDKMLNNMSKNKDASADCLYVRQNRLRQMKKDDPERYQRINGKRLEKNIGDTLNRATAETKTASPEIQEPLMNTVQTARTGTGKGHRKNGGATIYYENN
jgi:hypothetical protein